jgi:hypothetical protein
MKFGGIKKSMVLGVVTALAVTTLGTTAARAEAGDASPAASQIGGPIGRTEVIQRAADWMKKQPAYCANSKANCAAAGTPWTWDIGHTRDYRPDCSGLIDMAWHLGADPNTDGLAKSQWTTPIGIKDLQPGDLLDNTVDGHAVLFEGWKDSAKTTLSHYAETHPGSSMEHTTGKVNGKIAGWPASHYKAYQYKKIQGGDQPPTQKDTKLAYTGPGFVANGSAAELSATLTDKDGKAVPSREVDFTEAGVRDRPVVRHVGQRAAPRPADRDQADPGHRPGTDRGGGDQRTPVRAGRQRGAAVGRHALREGDDAYGPHGRDLHGERRGGQRRPRRSAGDRPVRGDGQRDEHLHRRHRRHRPDPDRRRNPDPHR